MHNYRQPKYREMEMKGIGGTDAAPNLSQVYHNLLRQRCLHQC